VDVSFIGGPYDGLRMDEHELRRLTHPVVIVGAPGIRVFVLMPDLADWEEVESGVRPPDPAAGTYAYEMIGDIDDRVDGPDVVYRDAVLDGSFARALHDGIRG
jgi:hypothetical protein